MSAVDERASSGACACECHGRTLGGLHGCCGGSVPEERDRFAKQLADLRMSLDYCAGQWESNAMPHTFPVRQPWQRAIFADCARDLRHALKANAPDAAGVRAELATLRALRAVASDFAATWAEPLAALPDSYGCYMNCPEANAAADLFRALGRDADADAIIAAHIEHDDEDGREAHEPATAEGTVPDGE